MIVNPNKGQQILTQIYDQHAAAFRQVSAFVIAKNGERVATVAIKFPKDGAGRLYAYVHWAGAQMERGSAGGYGYDKRSAAVAAALRKINPATITGDAALNAFVGAALEMDSND
jgi:hypothetical protein